jgi:protein-tyrosine-phosphatase
MVDEVLLARADLVLCMAQGHVEALQAEFPQHAHKIYLLSAMTGRAYSVADPYGQDIGAYRRMVKEVDDLINTGWPNIVTLAQENTAGR